LPFVGLVIDAPSAGGVPPPPAQEAPDGFTGLVASLLIFTAAERPQLPAASVATACTSYALGASPPVTQPTVPLHVAALHVSVPITAPLPQTLIVASFTLSVALALMVMLLP